MDKVVKYGNYLNELQFRDFTATDFDFLMYLCSVMRDKDEDVITLSIPEIKKIVNYDKNVTLKDFGLMLEKMNQKLMSITAKIKDGSKTIQFVLFPTFITDSKANTLTVRVNKDFKYLLNELTKNFTRFELKEFIQIKGKYSKMLYRLLKQYRTQGEYYVEVDEIKKLMDCPESYTNKTFVIRVLTPSVEELKKDFKGLICTPIRETHKQGRPLIAYKFTFQKQKPVPEEKDAKADRRQGASDSAQQPKDKPKKTKFSNFNEREYNYSDLEKVLLNQ